MEDHLLRFTRLKRDFVERFKLLIRSRKTRDEVSDIKLDALATKDLADIPNVDGDGVVQVGCGMLGRNEVTVFKAGIRQSVTKGEPGLGRGRIKMTVADVNVLNCARVSVVFVVVQTRSSTDLGIDHFVSQR